MTITKHYLYVTPGSIGSNSESLSRSASESSVSTGTGAGGAGGAGARAAGGSPESGLGGELAAQHATANGDYHDDHESDFEYYEPDLQPLGYCKALYPFEGKFFLSVFILGLCYHMDTCQLQRVSLKNRDVIVKGGSASEITRQSCARSAAARLLQGKIPGRDIRELF